MILKNAYEKRCDQVALLSRSYPEKFPLGKIMITILTIIKKEE
jgi:hypothetical protein